MKKILMTVIAVVGAMLLSAEMPRSEWHAKVGDCALDPTALKDTISQLSSADKTAFLAEVNAAIDKMPGSAESKAAKFLAANRAAVAGAGPADRADVLAEVFATVPPEVLPIIAEEFAKNEFARPDTMNIDDFTNIVVQALSKIAQRCSSAESGSVRAAFAGVMMINASGLVDGATSEEIASAIDAAKQAVEGGSEGTSSGTTGGGTTGGTSGGTTGGGTTGGASGGTTAGGTTGGAAGGTTAGGTTGGAAGGATAGGVAGGVAGGATGGAAGGGDSSPLSSVIAAVVSSLPSDVRSDAIGSWIPSAMGQGGSTSYDPMLAAAQANEEPNPQVVLDIAPSQQVESMLSDLQSGATSPGETRPGISGSGDPASASDPMNGSLSGAPRDRVQDPESPYYKGKNRGGSGTPSTGGVIPTGGDSSGGGSEPTPEPRPYWLQHP